MEKDEFGHCRKLNKSVFHGNSKVTECEHYIPLSAFGIDEEKQEKTVEAMTKVVKIKEPIMPDIPKVHNYVTKDEVLKLIDKMLDILIKLS